MFPHLRVFSFAKRPWTKGKNPLEKVLKYPVENAPCDCRFLSLLVVERVLRKKYLKRGQTSLFKEIRVLKGTDS